MNEGVCVECVASLVKTTASKVICYDNIGDRIKYKLNVIGIGCTSHVTIDFFWGGFIFSFELSLYVGSRFAVFLTAFISGGGLFSFCHRPNDIFRSERNRDSFPYPMPMPMAILTMFSLLFSWWCSVVVLCYCFRFNRNVWKTKCHQICWCPEDILPYWTMPATSNPMRMVYHHDALQLNGPVHIDLNCV